MLNDIKSASSPNNMSRSCNGSANCWNSSQVYLIIIILDTIVYFGANVKNSWLSYQVLRPISKVVLLTILIYLMKSKVVDDILYVLDSRLKTAKKNSQFPLLLSVVFVIYTVCSLSCWPKTFTFRIKTFS